MDTPSPRTSNLKYNLRPTPRDESPNVPVTSLIYVSISGTNYTPCTYFSFKSNSGSHNGTDRYNAPVTPAKRDNDRATQFLSVSATRATTITVVSIQTSAPPLPKMGRYTTNEPPVTCLFSHLKGRCLLLRGERLDSHHTD